MSKNIALFLSLYVVCSLFAITGSQFEGVPWLALIKKKQKKRVGVGKQFFFVLFQVNSIGGICDTESQTKLLNDKRGNKGVASLSLFRDEFQPNLMAGSHLRMRDMALLQPRPFFPRLFCSVIFHTFSVPPASRASVAINL